jgi:hypothetical protein
MLGRLRVGMSILCPDFSPPLVQDAVTQRVVHAAGLRRGRQVVPAPPAVHGQRCALTQCPFCRGRRARYEGGDIQATTAKMLRRSTPTNDTKIAITPTADCWWMRTTRVKSTTVTTSATTPHLCPLVLGSVTRSTVARRARRAVIEDK